MTRCECGRGYPALERVLAELQTKVDSLTVERDEYKRAIDALRPGPGQWPLREMRNSAGRGLSVRALNALSKAKILTPEAVGTLATVNGLLCLPNCGETTVREIDRMMTDNGYTLPDPTGHLIPRRVAR